MKMMLNKAGTQLPMMKNMKWISKNCMRKQRNEQQILPNHTYIECSFILNFKNRTK